MRYYTTRCGRRSWGIVFYSWRVVHLHFGSLHFDVRL